MHLLSLLLGQVKRSNSFLQELEASLFLANSEQLLGSSLIRSKSSHLSDEISDKLVVFGQLALGLTGLGLQYKICF